MLNKQKALGHKTVAAAAAEEIRRRILSGELDEGAPLRQEAFATEFGVSRIPIREALLQLEAEGLVRSLPHRGAVVSALSESEISELFELRALLEPRLLKLSAKHLTDDDFAALDDIRRRYSEELNAGNPTRWGELNTQLHLLLLSRADQPQTMQIVLTLLQQTDRYTRLQLALTQDNSLRAEEEHAELIRLCRAHEGTKAAALLEGHIKHAGKSLATFVKAQRTASRHALAESAG